VARPAIVLAVAAVLYLLAGLAFGRSGAVAWTIAVLIGLVATFGLCVAAVAVSERAWPFLPVLLASVVLLVSIPGAVGAWYFDAYGRQVEATIVEKECDKTRSGCVYHYRLRRSDGSMIERPYSPPGGLDPAVGDRIAVREDPRGLFGPRKTDDEDVGGTDVSVALWSGLVLVVTFVFATVTGEVRREKLLRRAVR
jgi:hypothetical protein